MTAPDAATIAGIVTRLEAATGPDRRIIDRLDRTPSCWTWTGRLDARGRGRVWHNGMLKLHHRAVWEILVGPIPEGALLCHHCDNPTCGNPSHIYVGNSKTNSSDMFARGRAWQQRDPERMKAFARASGSRNNWVKGEANPKAKLSVEQVAAIRSASGSSYKLAREIGVNASTIQRIRRGVSWTA